MLAALSGGVDSSVAALRLRQAGAEVVGVFMRSGAEGDGAGRSCCSAADARDAAAVADRLGIPFYAVDFAREFDALIDHFAAEYRRGRTPNPCVLCNQHLKFGQLFSLAEAVGADAVATGHYAVVAAGELRRARDADKDQTYYLFGVQRAALPRICTPLGGLTKAEVRAAARAAGLPNADKPESMEICFAPSGRYRDVVRARGGAGRPGVFVDETGREVGRHDGVDGFTVGQRRGLPALGAPHYVRAIDAARGVVVLSRRAGLRAARARVQSVNWLVDPPGPAGCEAQVKVRARSPAVPARIAPVAGSSPGAAAEVEVEFHTAVEAVAPGQAAVFYDGDLVLGGGWLAG